MMSSCRCRGLRSTTGTNTWAGGLDIVVEGAAVRVTDHLTLSALAEAYEMKYGSEWLST
jgi:hypothetical protein